MSKPPPLPVVFRRRARPRAEGPEPVGSIVRDVIDDLIQRATEAGNPPPWRIPEGYDHPDDAPDTER